MDHSGLDAVGTVPAGELKSALMEVLALEPVNEKSYEQQISTITSPPFSTDLVTCAPQGPENPETEKQMMVIHVNWEIASKDPAFR